MPMLSSTLSQKGKHRYYTRDAGVGLGREKIRTHLAFSVKNIPVFAKNLPNLNADTNMFQLKSVKTCSTQLHSCCFCGVLPGILLKNFAFSGGRSELPTGRGKF